MTTLTSTLPVFYKYWPGGNFFRPFLGKWNMPYAHLGKRKEWFPLADIAETEKEYALTLELPGIDMDALDISYGNDMLTIKGEKKKESFEGESCHCSERFSGLFHRHFRISGKVKDDEIKATYDDGILKIILPKSGESSVRKIELTS